MEQRIWFRKKWLRQSAVIEAPGLLKISSASLHERLEYNLTGASAVFVQDSNSDETDQHPLIQIKLDPKLQIQSVPFMTFRLLSAEDIPPWVEAFSRQYAIFLCIKY